MTSTPVLGPGGFVARHPFVSFVAVAYAVSWTLWALALAGGGTVPYLLGVFGPMAGAAFVVRRTGGSLRGWLRPAVLWRVRLRWWSYALGLPALLYAVVSLILQGLGEPVQWSLVAERLPGYASTFVFVLVIGGALEEPGWRGFGLPHLLQRHSPVVATLILGLVWGFWHVPLYGPAGFVVPTVLAFFYTYLWGRTGSVLMCILLHASFTPAQDHLILMSRSTAYTPELDTPDWVILGVYTVAAALLTLVTKGNLGVSRPCTRPAWRSGATE